MVGASLTLVYNEAAFAGGNTGVPRAAPHNYVTRATRPADFDDFWQSVVEQERKIPLKPEVVPDRLRSTVDVAVYQVFYDSLDNVRVAAWYCVPKKRTSSLPGLLYSPGYLSDPPIQKEWARRGYAVLTVAPRGKVRSRAQFDPGYPGLLTQNITDRNTYSYRGFYVDAWRGVDFLRSRREVDNNRIGAIGSSQGGGLTITAAAMRPEIKAAVAGAPYLVGFVDCIQLTHTYPYEEINDYLRLHPDSRDVVLKTLSYFDGINFARRIECPIILNIGLRDNVCPPETGYAVFNSIRSSEKRLYPYTDHGHDAGSHRHNEIVEQFFLSQLHPNGH